MFYSRTIGKIRIKFGTKNPWVKKVITLVQIKNLIIFFMGENETFFFKKHFVNYNKAFLENGIDYMYIQIKRPFPFKAWGMGVVTL